MILTAISLLITLLPNILSAVGGISPSLSDLIAKLGAAIPTLIADLTAGKGPSSDILAILKAFQTEIQALQQNTTLSPAALADAAALDIAITAALNAYQTAEVTDDPSTLTPLPTDLQDAPVIDADPATPIA